MHYTELTLNYLNYEVLNEPVINSAGINSFLSTKNPSPTTPLSIARMEKETLVNICVVN